MTRQRNMYGLIIGVMLVGMLLGGLVTSTLSSAHNKRIRRTILLNFKPEATPTDVQGILKEVKANISGIKGVRNIVAGPQINEKAKFQYGISMDFDDEDALKRYRQNEGHRDTHNKYVHLIEQAQITDLREE